MLPISEKSSQKEWKTILTIAKDNGYPSHIIHNLKTKLTGTKQKHKQQQNTQILQKQWVSFTYYSPLIRRITNLFKQTGLKIAFRAASTIQQQPVQYNNSQYNTTTASTVQQQPVQYNIQYNTTASTVQQQPVQYNNSQYNTTTASTIQQQLTQKQAFKNPSRIYKLKCNTCNAVYVGQSGHAINIRDKEHIRYTL
jgi:hypothetical protein